MSTKTSKEKASSTKPIRRKFSDSQIEKCFSEVSAASIVFGLFNIHPTADKDSVFNYLINKFIELPSEMRELVINDFKNFYSNTFKALKRLP